MFTRQIVILIALLFVISPAGVRADAEVEIFLPLMRSSYPRLSSMKLAFVSAGDIYIIDADGSNETNLTNSPEPSVGYYDPRWSPDGNQIAFVEADDIYVIDVDGGNKTNLTNNPDPIQSSDPRWSPDGNRIAFVETGDIYLMDVDGSNQRPLTRVVGEVETPSWGPRLGY